MRLGVNGLLPLHLAVWLLVILAVAGCAAPEVQPLTFNDAPWANGEVSLYEVTDRNDKYAGTVRYVIAAGGAQTGADGWTIHRETATQGDMETVSVEVTPKGVRPLYSLLLRTTPKGDERVETTYTQGQVDMVLTTAQDVTTVERAQVPSDAREQATVMMMIRSLPLASDYAVRFNAFLPVSKLLDRVTLQVIEREQVTVPAGAFDAWHVKLGYEDSTSEAWVGTEPPYPLVKYVDGRSRGVFELREFQPGQ